jgi:D-alanyl-D-alanine carboxypeptidase (penicillin-binding protein 5/6)
MNRTAVELGMKDTHYENPHGLTAERHLSTPADLAKLAQQAWRLPLFRKYVSTRKRGARLTTAEGIARNVVWENSNKLLGIEGYDGIKTGTTDAAGACLVSTGIRDGRRLIVVVLGSTSPDARYVDTRNLYRYAWNQLQGK